MRMKYLLGEEVIMVGKQCFILLFLCMMILKKLIQYSSFVVKQHLACSCDEEDRREMFHISTFSGWANYLSSLLY